MTVLDDRITMAEESGELSLDVLFEWLEKMPIPEGTKVEIVGGNIFMSPQRQNHWEIISAVFEQLRDKYPRKRLASDVRIDFPGHLNGFACDMAAMADRSVKDSKGRWRYQDVEFVAEVISKDTAANDYGPKKLAYATAEVPVYLIADPYKGRCYLYTRPKDGDYVTRTKIDFGDDIDLTGTVVGLVLKTDEFPRD
ncbi:Uma2 family endonuclease [Streptomyces sp. NY05-11A]|uniref:Uma2 family endonuclease n=1 Tax=Streptomyces soliscabiei TaxID=588897 RepID=UPI0029A4157B|nr:Uma2 family endonuclease [Streptomyces sp. NY05-11A]MDX2678846.1 Uma2 family endonuclease [Streptomyces sp. NY05-11A]